MKAYIATTGTIFGLIAVMHILRAVDERGQLQTHPTEYLLMTSLTFVAAALSLWAWLLLFRRTRA